MKPGIYPDMSMADYLAIPALSSGLCHTLLSDSPAHARHQQKHPTEANSAMDIGTYAHALLLEPGNGRLWLVDADDWRTKAAREVRDEGRAKGCIPILKGKVAEVESMVKAANEYIAGSEIAGIFYTGAPEVTLVWTETCDAGEVLCKARADWLSGDRKICLSYKTTGGSANPDVWIRTQLPSYDVATAFYERGVLAVCPEIEETRVVHLVQEATPPNACSLVALAPAFADLAERKLDRALNIWADCVARGKWPAYPSRICWAEPMPWDQQRFEEQEANHQQLTEDELKGGVPA